MPRRRRWHAKEGTVSVGRVVGIVFGSLVVLAGLGLVLGGGGVLVAERVLSNQDGYITFRTATINQDAYAVIAPVQIGGASGFWWRHDVTLHVEITARGGEGKPLFIGLADRADADQYLSGVSVAQVTRPTAVDVGRPRRIALEYRMRTGTTIPAPPTTQAFWVEAASGATPEVLDWRIEPGDYLLVLMNADGARLIHAAASVGFKAPIVATVAAVVLGIGAFLLALGVLAIVLSARRPSGGATTGGSPAGSGVSSPSASQPPAFPLAFHAEYSERLSPALWLVKWFLLIPHFVVLGFLWAGFVCSWAFSLVAILFTGRYPKGLFEYNVGVLRWTWRIGFYGYQALGTDAYPPFSLRAGGYPADLDIPYPAKLSRRLALVKWWLLAVPHYLIVAVLFGGPGPHIGGLVFLLTVFAGVILLFTSRYPRDLFTIIVGANRWAFRVMAYVGLMTDEYPPFRLET
jgi:hypothetical protein